MNKYPNRISYNGSNGNIREIYPTGRPEEPYEAFLDGGTLGYYLTEDLAYAAIQEALGARLDEARRSTLLERMRRS